MGQGTSSHFSEYYTTGKTIGIGTFATVKQCTRKSDKAQFAVKIIRKKELSLQEQRTLKDEIEILRLLKKDDHPHVIQLEDVFESETKVKLVAELCQEEDLMDLIWGSPKRRLEEKQAAQILETITKTIQYLHNTYVVHRDLKPENILFTTDNVLKIADFGSAHRFELKPDTPRTPLSPKTMDFPDFEMKTNTGTPLYVAPEILSKGKYSHMVDYWSLGVMLYTMLCGYPPFSNRKSLHKMYGNIIDGKYEFGALWDGIDEDAMDLVRKLLTVDAKHRIDGEQILAHKWMVKHRGKKKK
eukprot:71183_1